MQDSAVLYVLLYNKFESNDKAWHFKNNTERSSVNLSGCIVFEILSTHKNMGKEF